MLSESEKIIQIVTKSFSKDDEYGFLSRWLVGEGLNSIETKALKIAKYRNVEDNFRSKKRNYEIFYLIEIFNRR